VVISIGWKLLAFLVGVVGAASVLLVIYMAFRIGRYMRTVGDAEARGQIDDPLGDEGL
jgi:hypothetical protein